MKTTVLIIIIPLLAAIKGFAQIPQSPDSVNPNGKKIGAWTMLYDGNWKETKNMDSVKYYRKIAFLDGKPSGVVKDYYLSGKILWEGNLEAVNPPLVGNGLCTWYSENGNIRKKINYFNGLPNGEYQYYFPNGQQSIRGFMKSGLKDSLTIYYFPNGKIWSKIEFRQDSLWDVLFSNDSLGNSLPVGDLKNGNGYHIDYYMNGKKSMEGSIKNGVKTGSYKIYGEDDSWAEGNYIDGKMKGFWINWYSKDKICSEGEYKSDVKEGFWREYETDGSCWEGEIIHGKPDSRWAGWYSTGNKKGEHYYQGGKREGLWIDWYENGKELSVGSFMDDLKVGTWTEYNIKGKKFIGKYINDVKEGEWEWYGSDGTYKGKIFYKNGVQQN